MRSLKGNQEINTSVTKHSLSIRSFPVLRYELKYTFFFSNHRRLGLFCSAAQHVWTLAAMHKDLRLLAFSSWGTYMDLIKSISSWQTSSCNAYTIKRRRKNILWAQPQPRNIRGRKIGVQIWSWKQSSTLSVCVTLDHVTHGWLFKSNVIKEKQSCAVITAGDPKQPSCWHRFCVEPLLESVP